MLECSRGTNLEQRRTLFDVWFFQLRSLALDGHATLYDHFVHFAPSVDTQSSQCTTAPGPQEGVVSVGIAVALASEKRDFGLLPKSAPKHAAICCILHERMRGVSVLARRNRLCRWFAAAGVVQQAGEAEEHFARALELEARSEGRLLTSRLALASLGQPWPPAQELVAVAKYRKDPAAALEYLRPAGNLMFVGSRAVVCKRCFSTH